MPRRSTKSSNRRMPRNESRRISRVHHSPITSSDWASEQFMSAKDDLRTVPTVSELHHATQGGRLSCMTKLTAEPATTEFDRTTAVAPVPGRPGEFAVELDAGWSSLVGVHGGYMCAVAVRGAEALAEGRSVRTLTTSFLRTGEVGPATLSVRVVRE